MPTFGTVQGVKMNIFSGDHLPPHIHAEYNEHEELLRIENFTVYEGYLPGRQHQIAVQWLKTNQTAARQAFYELNPHLDAKNRKYTKSTKGRKR